MYLKNQNEEYKDVPEMNFFATLLYTFNAKILAFFSGFDGAVIRSNTFKL
jgi:hypothetical protein